MRCRRNHSLTSGHCDQKLRKLDGMTDKEFAENSLEAVEE